MPFLKIIPTIPSGNAFVGKVVYSWYLQLVVQHLPQQKETHNIDEKTSAVRTTIRLPRITFVLYTFPSGVSKLRMLVATLTIE